VLPRPRGGRWSISDSSQLYLGREACGCVAVSCSCTRVSLVLVTTSWEEAPGWRPPVCPSEAVDLLVEDKEALHRPSGLVPGGSGRGLLGCPPLVLSRTAIDHAGRHLEALVEDLKGTLDQLELEIGESD
jgi:hypothetical protein